MVEAIIITSLFVTFLVGLLSYHIGWCRGYDLAIDENYWLDEIRKLQNDGG